MEDAEWKKATAEEKLDWLHDQVLRLAGHVNGTISAKLRANENGISELASKIEDVRKLAIAAL